MPDLSCNIDGQACAITLEPGAFARLPDWLASIVEPNAPRLIVTDSNLVAMPWMTALADIALPPGESTKSHEGLTPLYDHLLERAFPRAGVLIAIGGGVISDAVGYVAATWLRGLRWVAVPTTLVGMVDAAIGGKVAINWRSRKNQIGAFHQPAGLLIDPEVLATLPRREYLSGVGEILKTACLEAGFFAWLEPHWEALLAGEQEVLAEAIERSVRIKRDIVIADPIEQGWRRRLNLGHTVGHALEAHWEGTVPHGLCVAYGLAIVARFAAGMQMADQDYAQRLESFATGLVAHRDTGDLPPFPEWELLARYLDADKKRDGQGRIRWQVPVRPGEVEDAILPLEARPQHRWMP